MPRGPEISDEEWEFLCGLFAKGYSVPDVMRQWHDMPFPLRDRRTIGKWHRRYEIAVQAVRQRVEVLRQEVAAEVDPLLVEARRTHFKALADLARSLRDDLSSILEVEYHPVRYSSIDIPSVALATEEEMLFGGLRGHIDDAELWRAFDAVKGELVAAVAGALDDRGAHFSADNAEVSRVKVAVPVRFRDKSQEPLRSIMFHGYQDNDFDLSPSILKGNISAALQGIERALLRGIVGGRCEFCPDVGGTAEGEAHRH